MNHIKRLLGDLGLTDGRVNEKTFFDICIREGIEFISSEVPFSWWMMVDGIPCIAIDRNLSGMKMLLRMFHELGHHFLHGGQQLEDVYAFGSNRSVKEFEADCFAMLAICPREVLLSGELAEAALYDPYIREFQVQREKLFSLYNE